MRQTMTISIPKTMKDQLDRLCERVGQSRSDLVRAALMQYFTQMEYQRLRRELLAHAEERGYFADQDIYRRIS